MVRVREGLKKKKKEDRGLTSGSKRASFFIAGKVCSEGEEGDFLCSLNFKGPREAEVIGHCKKNHYLSVVT